MAFVPCGAKGSLSDFWLWRADVNGSEPRHFILKNLSELQASETVDKKKKKKKELYLDEKKRKNMVKIYSALYSQIKHEQTLMIPVGEGVHTPAEYSNEMEQMQQNNNPCRQ